VTLLKDVFALPFTPCHLVVIGIHINLAHGMELCIYRATPERTAEVVPTLIRRAGSLIRMAAAQ
jgi:hypothetical protein